MAASALTNVVVFTPIAFMQGIIGQFFLSFGLTVVFATLFSGFAVIPDDVTTDALFKGLVLFGLLTAIDIGWLFAGDALRHLFHDPGVSRRINIGFAILLLVSVALAVGF